MKCWLCAAPLQSDEGHTYHHETCELSDPRPGQWAEDCHREDGCGEWVCEECHTLKHPLDTT